MSDRTDVQHIFRWDLDKTYLATDFDTIGDLVKTFLQKAKEKTNIPGADALLGELLLPSFRDKRRVTFISGSPSQMRNVLEEKLRIDGIEPDLFILKPTMDNILRGKFRAVRGQVGYKLDALLSARKGMQLAPETLFGDDAESDAMIYALYDDITAGRVGRAYVQDVMKAAKVYPDTAERILWQIREMDLEPTVSRIFINLERRTPTSIFDTYGARVVPIYNYFQAALILFNDRILDAGSVLRIALDMNQRHQYSPAMLANSFQDLLRRRRISSSVARRLADELSEAHIPAFAPRGLRPEEIQASFKKRLEDLASSEVRAMVQTDVLPDYVALAKHGKPPKPKKTKKKKKTR